MNPLFLFSGPISYPSCSDLPGLIKELCVSDFLQGLMDETFQITSALCSCFLLPVIPACLCVLCASVANFSSALYYRGRPVFPCWVSARITVNAAGMAQEVTRAPVDILLAVPPEMVSTGRTLQR